MNSGQRIIDELRGLFADDRVAALSVSADGEIFLAAGSTNRPHQRTLDAAELEALADAIGEGTVASKTVSDAAFTVMRPPLAAGIRVIARRIPRPARPLGQLVDDGLMSSKTAQGIVQAVREARNILVVGPEERSNVTLFDAMLALVPPGQSAYVIGRREEIDAGATTAAVLDRATLDGLADAVVPSIERELGAARWVFAERVANARDVRWWFAGRCFGSGRVATLTAPTEAAARRRLRALHRAAFDHTLDVDAELVDAVIFVEHLRPGRGESVRLVTAQESQRSGGFEPVARTQSQTAIAPVVEARAASMKPAESASEPTPPAPPKAAEPPPSSGVRRRSGSSPRLRRPASMEIARTGQMPRLETPDTQTGDQPPGNAISASALDDLSNIFDDNSADLGAVAEHNSAPTPAPPAPAVEVESIDEGAAGGLFGPGDLDDMFGSDLGELSVPTSAPANPRHPQPGTTGGPSRYNADTTRNDADTIRRSRYQRSPSQEMRTARRPTPNPFPAVGQSAPTPSASNWDRPPTANRPMVGRGAATRSRVARPSSPELIASDDVEMIEESGPRFDGNSFMQEGTLGDDVEGDFADEPTRRAEWPGD